jgi:cytochrome c oxidase subunit 3
MILFIASEVMFFGGLFAAYLSLRASAETWPPAGSPTPGILIPSLLTAVLVTSSVTQHRAAAAPDAPTARKWLGLTIALGALFIGGQGLEWAQLGNDGLTMGSSSFGTSFFTLTGAHGLHVVGGLGMLAATWVRIGSGPLGPRPRATLEGVTYYWHFVDLVWIVVFTTLYVA